MAKKVGGRKIIFIVFIIVLVAAVFFTFIYVPKCGDIACWEYKLQKCSKAVYFVDKTDVVWDYKIIGKSGDSCNVNVKVLEIKKGLTTAKTLEGKDMNCLLPLGVITDPESNPNLCNGILKEEMQGIIINKLHQYILQNVGSIGKELTEIEGVTQTIVGNNTGNNTK